MPSVLTSGVSVDTSGDFVSQARGDVSRLILPIVGTRSSRAYCVAEGRVEPAFVLLKLGQMHSHGAMLKNV